jgi:hypothetical protein
MGARNRPGVVARLRQRAAAVLWAETLLGAAAPSAGIMLAYLVLVLFGLGHPLFFTAAIVLALLALAFGIRAIRPPTPDAIDRRIEAASGLKHRPLAALADAPEANDPAALALWRTHQARIMRSLSTARTGSLNLQAAARDPYALRGFLLFLLITGCIVAGSGSSTRLTAGFALPSWPFAGPEVDAWITPPDYTGAPPRLLTQGEAVTALQGSKLTIITDGPRHAPKIQLNQTDFALTALSPSSHRADAVIMQSGRLTIGPWWHRLAAWNITVTPPAAPVITVTKLILSPGSKMTFAWHVQDPYGVADLRLAFHVAGYPDALPENFALPVLADGTATIDRSESPFHNLPVDFTLSARNLAGITGSLSPAGTYALPGLDLHDKTALALDALRQALAVEPANAAAVAPAIHALAAAPPSAITASADVQMAALATAMALHQISPADAAARLLALVKETDAGEDFATRQALARSNQALLSALQNGLNGQPPDAAQLQQLIQAMEQALAQHLANTQPQNFNGQAPHQIDMSSLEQLAAQIAKDEAAGRTAQAARELQQLQATLQALANARPMTAQQAAQSQAANRAAQGLSQVMGGEAGLLNKTNQGTATAAQQAALQAALNGIEQGLKGAKMDVPGLAQAGQAMSAAAQALGQGDNPAAAAAEMSAIQQMQKAESSLSAATQNQFSIGQNSGNLPNELPMDTGVNGGPDETLLPGLDTPVANPASIIQQQIMKQDSTPGLPAPTHQYLQRLLNPGN